MSRSALPSFLRADVDLLFFGGKGGVGKTTCAAATALHRSRRQPVRLLSTDPAHSLTDSLAVDDPDDLPASLTVEELDAEAELDDFRSAHRETLFEIVDRGSLFDEEAIRQLLDLSLPGMDEVMAFLRLADQADRPTPDATSERELVVVDTAPTGHTLRLLDTPDQFARWVDFLDLLLEKHRTMRSVFGGGTEPDDLDRFVNTLNERTDRVHALLRTASRCRFVVVTQAEPVVEAETRRLVEALRDRSVSVAGLVVNRWREDDGAQTQTIRTLQASVSGTDPEVWILPEADTEIRGVDRLAAVWDQARPLPADPSPPVAAPCRTRSARPVPQVHAPLRPPAADLLLVAGKGGVGKTTVASATALRLARSASGDQAVLLASTDPAHSLAAALDAELSDDPTPVAKGLDAVEVDAAGRFEALRAAYGQEVRAFFRDAGGPNVDLTHDRRVTESLMSLAPPGIDEVMGWIAVMEFLDEDRYDMCVLDTAPTGHFVRLLEMPTVFGTWIRTFFRILRDHRHIVRLPDLVDRLVRLSKQVKALRSLFRTGTASVLGVTIPTAMAVAEMDDLRRSAAEHNAGLAALVVNRVAAATAPPSRRRADAAVLRRYRRVFRDVPMTLVSEGRPPRGARDLRHLGNRLYNRRE